MRAGMLRIFEKLRHFIASMWPWHARRRFDSFNSVVTVEPTASTLPKPGQLLIVASGDKAKWVRMLCPCGCRELLALNLMGSHSPRWTTTRDVADRLTVHPSVHSTTCGAHFFIRSNRIEWC